MTSILSTEHRLGVVTCKLLDSHEWEDHPHADEILRCTRCGAEKVDESFVSNYRRWKERREKLVREHGLSSGNNKPSGTGVHRLRSVAKEARDRMNRELYNDGRASLQEAK